MLAEDIEVNIENTNNELTDDSFIRHISYARKVDKEHLIISHMEYGKKNGTLESVMTFDSTGFKTSETSFTWLQNFRRRRCHFPSGYTLDIFYVIKHDTPEWFSALISLTDAEGRPHGLLNDIGGKGHWYHGIPVSSHKMYLFESGNENDGRAYFFPLKDGYFLIDYFYVYMDYQYGDRMYNIYRLGTDASAVGFVFGKGNPHIFRIVKRAEYELAPNEYFVPVDFVFQDHDLPTADDTFFDRQKTAAQAFIDAQELPSEEYYKSAHHYESALFISRRRLEMDWSQCSNTDSDQDTIYVNART